MKNRATNCVILAAGEGKRMFARSSKVLCEVTLKPMILWVADAARASGIDALCAVVSNPDVERVLVGSGCSIRYQTERLGTGHAVRSGLDFLEAHRGEDTLILYGDVPFINSETILQALSLHRESGAAVTVISAELEQPTGYGRIIRNAQGSFTAIVEELDCSEAERAVREINSGVCWFDTDSLIGALGRIRNDNAKGEYYLTDAIKILIGDGKTAEVYKSENTDVTLGANNPSDLLKLNRIAAERTIARHIAAGVHFIDLAGVVIGPDVEIAPGATVLPGSILSGKTRIGSGSVIGPNAQLCSLEVGEDCVFNASRGCDAVIGNGAKIGPFVMIPPGSRIADGSEICVTCGGGTAPEI